MRRVSARSLALKRERKGGVNHHRVCVWVCISEKTQTHRGPRRHQRRRSEKRVPAATKAAPSTMHQGKGLCARTSWLTEMQRRRRVCCTRRIKGASEREQPLMLIKFNFPLIVKKMMTAAAGDEALSLCVRSERGRRICGDRRKITASAVGLNTTAGEPPNPARRLLSRIPN